VKKVLLVGIAVAAAMLMTAPAMAAEGYTASGAVKLDVLGEWAHPDDDTSIIGPCGVWRQRYGTKCGIIMITRGEGGGNAVGTELGPALGLRRENEDRVAHFRSGTVDIFNLDRVDFFYNQSAPLTQFFWGQDETLRRITRIIRMTQPEIYLGFTPTLNAGHGNHQQAGRYIWEGVLAAADPNMFPEQLRGPDALDTWQVKKVFSGGSTAGTGGTTTAPDCTTGFTPTGLDNVAGVWTGYDSPYKWPPGNVQGQPAGSAKTWAQVAREGTFAYPTQSRPMFKDVFAPGCSRFGMTDSFVPFQPNGTPAAGKDDAILYGAAVQDPGGLPKGTLEYLTFSRFYNAPGEPFEATLHLRSGSGRLDPGTVTLSVPSGWTATPASRPVGAVGPNRETTVTFEVTPSASAAVNSNFKISAEYETGPMSGYTDDVVRVVPPAEGRFQRWGKWAEYDAWLEGTAPQARRLGRSAAIQSMGAGETITVPVDVHNWSLEPQSGEVSLALPAGMTADDPSKSYGTLAPGADTTVEFEVSNSFTNATLPGAGGADAQATNVTIPITTTYDSGSSSEDLTMSIVPKTAIEEEGAAPTVDGEEGSGEYTGEELDVGRKWEPGGANRNCEPAGVDCGSAGANRTYAKVSRHGDDLYFLVRVRDDFQSYAVTPAECVGHWQADSVELLIDPRGNASERNRDTASTFKLAVFPFTNDPSGSNGNGPNGPCWSRDADNHQGYSTGPLAATVSDAPNAPGVQVATDATWVGSNDTSVDHAYAGGGYTIEVKVPMATLPAAVDPDRMGLNITPYDNDDNTPGTGSTTLRHIDMSTRLAWSTFGSVQSDPYRWGRATLPGYTPPVGRPTEPADPHVSNPNLNGAESPQTIAQSARDGVPISGRVPAPPDNRITAAKATRSGGAIEVELTANGPGTARLYAWSGDTGYIPVFKTSCDPATNPPPDYGLSACSVADGDVPPWGTDMSGRVKGSRTVTLGNGVTRVTLPDAERVLVSFETTRNEVQALDLTPGRPGGGQPGGRCANEIRGTSRADRLVGTRRGDRITGRGGDDRIMGRGGRDCLRGGTGRDRVAGGSSSDVLEGNSGGDRLSGGGGGDRIAGGSGQDRIKGGSGRDRIKAGSGRDRIHAKDGRRDTIDCGRGRDTVASRDKADRLKSCEVRRKP
jgi:Ca2+-binding RTX toxin-like protein